MNIGFYLKWNKGSMGRRKGNVLGDELYAESLASTLRTHKEVDSAEVYAPNYQPKIKLDVMIYLNDTTPVEKFASKHVLYMQNAYSDGSDLLLKKFQRIGYDGYIFISNRLLDIHNNSGYTGIYLPFGVDPSVFYPRQKESGYSFDVAYVGNDIKGSERTNKYLMPAVKYNLGLYGNWKRSIFRDRILGCYKKQDEYKNLFEKLSKGRIPQSEVPVLYSSARINLNCTAQDCVDWDVITLRTFEVLACKGFLISDIVPSAAQSLQDCVVFTDGGDDLCSKIDFFLGRPDIRDEFADNGYQYVIKNATILARGEEMKEYLEALI